MYTTDNLKKLPKLGQIAPEATTAFWAFDKAALAGGRLIVSASSSSTFWPARAADASVSRSTPALKLTR